MEKIKKTKKESAKCMIPKINYPRVHIPESPAYIQIKKRLEKLQKQVNNL